MSLAQQILKDDKSKLSTIIACGCATVALIYHQRAVREQLSNIFMVSFIFCFFFFIIIINRHRGRERAILKRVSMSITV